jgi:hypothetical protein
MIVGNSTTSNQLEAGSIMVRAMKSIDKLSLTLSVYGPTRSTQRASHGVLITILGGKYPYFWERFLFTWQVLHDFVMDRWCFSYLSSISQPSLSLRDEYAQGAEDSGDTT